MTIRSWGSKALLPAFEKLWPKIKIKQIGSAGKVQIWSIHGEELRSYTDDKGEHPFIDFTEGGNWQAYSWLPHGLIIIDADATRNEQELTKLHELGEANDMEAAGDDYDTGKHPAHRYANKIEGKARSDPSQYPMLWKHEVDRRMKMEGAPETGASATVSGANGSQNDLIQAAISKIESQLTPQNRSDCDKIVVAGMHVALKGGATGWAAQMAKSPDPVNAAIKGAVNMVLMMRKHTQQGTMPLKALVPAATILMLNGLGFCENSGALKVDETTISDATKKLADYLMRAFGLTPDRVKAAAGRVHDMMQDPQKMAKIHAAAGSTPDVRKVMY